MQESKYITEIGPHLNEVTIENLIASLTFVLSNKSKEYILEKTPAGFIKNVAEKISFYSVLQDEDSFKKKILECRAASENVQNVIENLITKAFPGMSYSELENMTQLKQFEYFVKAEKITKETLDLGIKNNIAKDALKTMRNDMTIIGGDITAPGAGDLPEFNGRP